MKLYELAKKTGMEINQLKGELGYKSHMKKVPDEIVAEYLGNEKKIQTGQEAMETVDSAEAVVVTVPPEIETDSLKSTEEIVEERNSRAPEAGLSGGEDNEPVQDAAEESTVNVSDDTGSCPYDLKEIDLGIRCLGSKAPQWKWRHLIG
jgi:hypothetical protein